MWIFGHASDFKFRMLACCNLLGCGIQCHQTPILDGHAFLCGELAQFFKFIIIKANHELVQLYRIDSALLPFFLTIKRFPYPAKRFFCFRSRVAAFR